MIFGRALVLVVLAGLTVPARGDPVPRTPPLPGLFKDFSAGQQEFWNQKMTAADEYERRLRQRRVPVPAPDSQSFSISNPADQSMPFSIWNPEYGEWQKFEVPPHQFTTVTCPKCERKAKIAFSDGKEQRIYSLALGNFIKIDWSQADGVWTLRAEPPDALALDQ